MKYEDELYTGRTKHVIDLEKYLKDDLGLSNYKEIVEDLAGMLMIGDDEPDYVIRTLKRMAKPKFKEFASKEQAYNFLFCIRIYEITLASIRIEVIHHLSLMIAMKWMVLLKMV